MMIFTINLGGLGTPPASFGRADQKNEGFRWYLPKVQTDGVEMGGLTIQ